MKNLISFLLAVPAVAIGQIALTTAQIATKVSPAVVVIAGKTDSGDVLGSGFIISKEGKIVTNLHVIRDMKTARVELANGDVFDSVFVIATDERRDLAIVQIPGFNLPVLEFGNSDIVKIGEPLVILGSPQGLSGTVTAGILSAVRDSGEGFKVLQTDAAVNPGNSGGPLVNGKGEAIGVVSFKLRSAEGLNFAVPINYVSGLLSNSHELMTLDQMRKGLTAGIASKSNSADPSLKDTLEWLRENIPLGSVHCIIEASNGMAVSMTEQSSVFRLDSCTVVVGRVRTATTAFTPVGKMGSMRYTLPIGTLIGGSTDRVENPACSHGDRSGYRVILKGKSGEISAETFDSDFNNSRAPVSVENTDGFYLIFNNESTAQRVLAAFLHAADLCRQKEPF